ncbi:MAG: D-glycero-beta-D-manno-heptose 1-phosphate adenylyltransferase [Chloroflexota bacterium]|nr:D-glycero-beta-D-manno-heptose 1-phosphate adenylyltransferase [Chloroflexota bacterium]
MRQFLSATETVQGFAGLRALVIGDAMLDTWLEGDAIRLCKEAPVPVVREVSTTHCPGGAANTAVNLAAFGADVAYVAFIGRDQSGQHLREAFHTAGIDDRHLIEDAGVSTLHKVRVIASGQYVVRFDEGSTDGVSSGSRLQMLERIAALYPRCDLVVVSDYCHGAISDEVITLLGELQQSHPSVLVIDSKTVARFAHCPSTMVTPNLQEARRAVEPDSAPDQPVDLELAHEIGQKLRGMLRSSTIAVTMAEQGVLLTGPDGKQSHVPCHPVARASDVGAGDTFTAATAMALAAGALTEQAVHIGIDAASIAITRGRTSTVSAQDLLRRVSLAEATPVRPLKEVVAQLEIERFHGKRIVFTNGVFDILHAGHVNLLRRAKALGDVLVVGINSDASTRRLKGPRRPVNREADRLALVSALDAVDYAVIFEEDTPAEVIRTVRPHVHVKGGDYQADTLPELDAVREVGAEIAILSLVEGRSTTSLIDRIVATATLHTTDRVA